MVIFLLQLFLDELSVIFNNGCRPTYSLFLDESHETTRYVYQVNFMGKDYVPPNHLYSSNPNDARIVSAQYVLKVIGIFICVILCLCFNQVPIFLSGNLVSLVSFVSKLQ